MASENAYTILNIRKGATDQEIKQAYVALVKKFDPESHTDRFVVIQHAYDRLSDPIKRAREDVLTFNHVHGEFHFSKEERGNHSGPEIHQRIRILEEKRRENPNDETVNQDLLSCYMQRSFTNVKKKMWKESIRDWQSVLGLDETHLRAKNNLLFAYIALGYSYATHELYDEAIELWEQASQMNPDDVQIIHNLALACDNSGRREDAERYWDEVLKRWKLNLDQNPDDEYLKNCIVEVRRHHGGRAAESGKNAEVAIEDFREILKIKPNDFEAQYQIASTLMEEHKWSEAVEELQKLHKQFPKNIEVLNLRGWALLNGGQVEQAFQTWRRSYALDKKNQSTRDALVRAHLSVGKRLRERGLFTPALVHFKALLRYLPKSPEVHFEIASTYLLKGDERPAYNEFNRVLAIDPRNKNAKKALSELKMRR